MIEYRTVFQKKDQLIYISHLDLMTLMRRAIRRADLPFVLTKGFTPRVKINVPKALKLGISSSNEEMTIWLTENIKDADVVDVINKELPEGIKITSIKSGKAA